MEVYKVVVLVILKSPDASVQDFEQEIEMFNEANKGIIEVEVITIDGKQPESKGG